LVDGRKRDELLQIVYQRRMEEFFGLATKENSRHEPAEFLDKGQIWLFNIQRCEVVCDGKKEACVVLFMDIVAQVLTSFVVNGNVLDAAEKMTVQYFSVLFVGNNFIPRRSAYDFIMSGPLPLPKQRSHLSVAALLVKDL